MPAVWLCEPRSHGRRKAGAPLPERTPSSAVPHRPASPALCLCGHAASFRRRASSSFVRGVWTVPGAGGAATSGGAGRAGAARAARSAARVRVLLSCGCVCFSGGACVATLAVPGGVRAVRAVHSSACVAAACARGRKSGV